VALVAHRKRGIEEVQNYEKDEEDHHIESDKVAAPVEVSKVEPKADAEDLSRERDLAHSGVILPLGDYLEVILKERSFFY
jgi:hypothetical protein